MSYKGDECRNIEFKEPVANKAMKKHVIRRGEVLNEGSCRLLCYMEPHCVSINLGPSVDGKHKCELNNITDENHLRRQKGFTYLAIEVFPSPLSILTPEVCNLCGKCSCLCAILTPQCFNHNLILFRILDYISVQIVQRFLQNLQSSQ